MESMYLIQEWSFASFLQGFGKITILMSMFVKTGFTEFHQSGDLFSFGGKGPK